MFLLLFSGLLLVAQSHGAEDQATTDLPYPVSIFLQADPLVGLATALSTRALYDGLIWSVAVLLVTMLMGRFFCGWVCPLGTLQHLVSWVATPWRKVSDRISGNRYTRAQRLKYYLLAGLLVASLFTTVQIGLLDPICLTTRSLGTSIVPAVDEAVRSGLEAMQDSRVPWLESLAGVGEELRSRVLPVRTSRNQGAWLIGVLFVALVGVSVRWPRFWCRHVCPLGALLGASSRTSLFGLTKHEDRCTHCNHCLEVCQGASEPIAGERWRVAECLMCFNCEAACPEDALSFELLHDLSTTERSADLSRRALIGSMAAGAAALPLLRTSAGFAGPGGEAHDPKLIRPPGSLPEDEFLARCVKCGECMKVCPTNALQPAALQAGIEGLWTPVLVPRIGYCEPSCTLCGEVCPTGAIARFTLEQKTGDDHHPPIRMGTAFYDRGRCLPWAMDTPCIVCEEWCPANPKAIWLEPVTVTRRDGTRVHLQRPHLDPTRCTGCGACEHACPVSDEPAVRVTSAGESRHPHNRLLLDRSQG